MRSLLRAGPTLRALADIGQSGDGFDEYLRQLVDSVVNQHVACAGDGRGTVRDIVYRSPYARCSSFAEHARDGGRRGELSSQTLHENCTNPARVDAIRQAIDRFGFHAGSTAHVGAM